MSCGAGQGEADSAPGGHLPRAALHAGPEGGRPAYRAEAQQLASKATACNLHALVTSTTALALLNVSNNNKKAHVIRTLIPATLAGGQPEGLYRGRHYW